MRRPPTLLLAALLSAALACAGCLGERAGDRLEAGAPRAAAPRPIIQPGWTRQVVEATFWDGSPLEYSRPTLVCDDALIVAGTSAGRVVALRRDTGEEAWSFASMHRIDGGITWIDDLLIVGNDGGDLFALTCEGKVAWREHLGAEFDGAPAVSASMAFAQDSTDKIFAVALEDGKLIWTFERPAPDYFTLSGFSAPTLTEDDSTLFAGFGDGSLVALEADTGKVLWQRDLSNGETKFMDVDGHPAATDDTVYAASYAGGIFALRREDGEILWRYDVTGASTVVVDEDTLYATTASRYVIALDRHTGVQRWRIRHAEITPTAPILAGDYLLYGATDYGIYVLDRKTGHPLVMFDPARGFSAPLHAIGPEGYALSNGGYLYQFYLQAP